MLGKNFNFLVAADGDAEPVRQVDAAFKGASDNDREILYRRKDGSECWATIFINPVRDEARCSRQHFVSLVDVTKHKQAHAQAKTLIDELNHRVKNTLSTMQSIVWQAFKNASDTEAIRESIEARLFALSRSHDLLTREHWESAGLRDLVNDALEPFGVANGRAERFSITGSNVRLPPKAILALGIALHELATNAVKYGAFSNAAGSILIAWVMMRASALSCVGRRWMARPSHPRRAKGSVRKYSNEVWLTSWKGRCILIINQTAWSARSTFLHREVPMEAKPLAGRHILLLEDEMMILLMMEEMLIDLGGASVTSAATVGQALTKIDCQVFDAAMLDVNLNGTKSYPVAERLAARGIPFVFSTGYSDHAPGMPMPTDRCSRSRFDIRNWPPRSPDLSMVRV